MAKKTTKKPKVVKAKTTTLFEHLNAIQTNQAIGYWDNLDDGDRKSYSVYMINRLVSMNMDYVELVNEFQKLYGPLTERESYLFYSQMLPRKKQWSKYVKAKKTSSYEGWVIELVAHHFQISQSEAETYMDLYMATPEGVKNVKSLLEKYGIEPKKIKKVLK